MNAEIGGSPLEQGSHIEYLHEQTGLTAGTIADDDELATDLGHLDKEQVSIGANKQEWTREPRKSEIFKNEEILQA